MVARIANQRNDGGRTLMEQSRPFAVIGVIAIRRTPTREGFMGIGHRLIRPALDFIGDEEVQFQHLCVDLLLGVHVF